MTLHPPPPGVWRQTFVILNQVNRARKAARLELTPTSCVRLKRRIYRPFAAPVAVGTALVGDRLADQWSSRRRTRSVTNRVAVPSDPKGPEFSMVSGIENLCRI